MALVGTEAICRCLHCVETAMEILAEMLRLELAPFGVGVLSIITGAVQSLGQTYFDDLRLPDNSIYK